jgi:hypothetical protein
MCVPHLHHTAHHLCLSPCLCSSSFSSYSHGLASPLHLLLPPGFDPGPIFLLFLICFFFSPQRKIISACFNHLDPSGLSPWWLIASLLANNLFPALLGFFIGTLPGGSIGRLSINSKARLLESCRCDIVIAATSAKLALA